MCTFLINGGPLCISDEFILVFLIFYISYITNSLFLVLSIFLVVVVAQIVIFIFLPDAIIRGAKVLTFDVQRVTPLTNRIVLFMQTWNMWYKIIFFWKKIYTIVIVKMSCYFDFTMPSRVLDTFMLVFIPKTGLN